jgi:hypothetical protein
MKMTTVHGHGADEPRSSMARIGSHSANDAPQTTGRHGAGGLRALSVERVAGSSRFWDGRHSSERSRTQPGALGMRN